MERLRPAAPTWGDLLAGVTVALVLIPQAIAYAGLAGLAPEHGIYAAAFAPLASALIGSSPYLQTGPTAVTALLTFGALAAVAAPFTVAYAALAALLALVVAAIRAAIGLLRAGIVAYLMSQPVVVGFTGAAGVLIVLSQIPALVGVPTEEANPLLAAWEAVGRPGRWDAATVGFGLGAAAATLGLRRVHPLVPSVPVAVVGGTALAAALGYNGALLGDLSVGLPALASGLPWDEAPRLLLPGAVIAVVGFAEPAAIARHHAMLERRHWDPNRELIGQGLANAAAGLAGGFPVGGSFSRTALSRMAGARTRWSGAVTSLAVLASLPLLGLLASLPRSVLAGIVIAAVASLLDVRPLLAYRRFARLQFAVALVTAAATLAFAPHVERGVLVGVGAAVAAHLWRELRLSIVTQADGDALHVRPRGVLYFGSSPQLEDAVGRLIASRPQARRLLFHLDGLGRVDLTGALVLRDLVEDAKAAGLAVEVLDVPPQAGKIVGRVLAGQAPVSFLVEGGGYPSDRVRRPRPPR